MRRAIADGTLIVGAVFWSIVVVRTLRPCIVVIVIVQLCEVRVVCQVLQLRFKGCWIYWIVQLVRCSVLFCLMTSLIAWC